MTWWYMYNKLFAEWLCCLLPQLTAELLILPKISQLMLCWKQTLNSILTIELLISVVQIECNGQCLILISVLETRTCHFSILWSMLTHFLLKQDYHRQVIWHYVSEKEWKWIVLWYQWSSKWNNWKNYSDPTRTIFIWWNIYSSRCRKILGISWECDVLIWSSAIDLIQLS